MAKLMNWHLSLKTPKKSSEEQEGNHHNGFSCISTEWVRRHMSRYILPVVLKQQIFYEFRKVIGLKQKVFCMYKYSQTSYTMVDYRQVTS